MNYIALFAILLSVLQGGHSQRRTRRPSTSSEPVTTDIEAQVRRATDSEEYVSDITVEDSTQASSDDSSSSSPGQRIEGIRWVSMKERNELLWIVRMALEFEEAVYVEYEPVDYIPSVPRLRSKLYPKALEHDVYLFRLYGNTKYEFDIFFDGKYDKVYSGTFRTGRAPRDILNKDPTLLFGEPTWDLIYTGRDDPGYHFVFDSTGEIVYYLEHRGFPGDAFDRRPNGNVIFIPRDGGVVEVSPEGDVIAEVDTGCFLPHHSISLPENDENKVWLFSKKLYHKEEYPINETSLRHDQAVDVIIEVDLQTGTVEIEADLITGLSITEDRTRFSDQPSEAANYFPCEPEGVVNDWARLNSLYVRDENFMVIGSHHLEEVWGFGRMADGDLVLNWRITHDERSSFEFPEPRDKFYGQHEVQELRNGNLLINDNGIGRPDEEGGWFTRGLELKLDFSERPWRAWSVWEFALNITDFVDPRDWVEMREDGTFEMNDINRCADVWLFDIGLCTSGHRGSLERLENGNTLMIFTTCDCDPSERGYIAEISPNEELVSLFAEFRGGSYLFDFQHIDSIGGETVI